MLNNKVLRGLLAIAVSYERRVPPETRKLLNKWRDLIDNKPARHDIFTISAKHLDLILIEAERRVATIDIPPGRAPAWVHCDDCGHEWIAAYTPMDSAKLSAAMFHAMCPMCGSATVVPGHLSEVAGEENDPHPPRPATWPSEYIIDSAIERAVAAETPAEPPVIVETFAVPVEPPPPAPMAVPSSAEQLRMRFWDLPSVAERESAAIKIKAAMPNIVGDVGWHIMWGFIARNSTTDDRIKIAAILAEIEGPIF